MCNLNAESSLSIVLLIVNYENNFLDLQVGIKDYFKLYICIYKESICIVHFFTW